MSKAETLRNIRVLLVIHLGGEHIIRPRINFEVAAERLIDHQRFAGFCVRGDSEYLIQLVLKVQVFFTDKNFFLKPFIFPPILYFYYNREEGKEKEHTRNQVCSILMVNAKTFRTMKKSLYLRIMVDLKGISEPSTSRMRTERSPKLSYKPEYMCQEKRFEQTQLNREERGTAFCTASAPN